MTARTAHKFLRIASISGTCGERGLSESSVVYNVRCHGDPARGEERRLSFERVHAERLEKCLPREKTQ